MFEGEGSDDCGAAEDKEDVEEVGADDVSKGELSLLLHGGDDARRKFRQGSASGEDSDGDEFVADACGVGDIGCAVNEEAAAENKACKAPGDEKDGDEDASRLCLRPGFFIGIFPLFDEGEGYVSGKKSQQYNTVDAGETVVAGQAQDDQKDGDSYVNRNVDLAVGGGNAYRQDHRGDSQDEESVEYVRADDVAYGDVRVAFQRSDEADDHFGGRCPHADYGEADDELADSEAAGYRGRSVDKRFGACDYQSQAEQEKEYISKHILRI